MFVTRAMLPSRGIPKANPASALRYSLSSRIQPARSSPSLARHISQARSPSAALNRGILRPLQSQYGAQLPRPASIGMGAGASSLGVASGVFAQRAGASRNLSLWPFSSKKPEPLPLEAKDAPVQTTSPAEPPPPPSVPQSQAPELAANPPAADPATTPLPSDDAFGTFDMPSVLDIPEQIGYLKTLGLDYGWGPTSCVQWFLEHIYIYTGLPWWGSIAVVGVLYRAVMFMPTLTGARHQYLIQKVHSSPEFLNAKAAFEEAAYRTQDQTALLQARATMSKLTKNSGAQIWRPFVGMAMIPFSFGMFRLGRGMAAIPVPSLETGGVAWFTDLTVPDPYFILPVASIAMSVLMMKQLQAASLNKTPMQLSVNKMMIYVFPPLIFLGTAWLPAFLQWFFFVVSAGSIVQSAATVNPVVRRWIGLPPVSTFAPRPSPTATAGAVWQPPTPRGLLDGVKKDMSNVSTSIRNTMGNTETKTRLQKAQDYEERRASEEKERASRRMDEIRRRRMERERR
ncbi:60Kd inner membrane protein-domain-containing protein [Biscogniauxia sp. FL1348]|nr:60Kd inner membrane protein-domain-containing protein [Biscogniauxia sp. FL1348]